MLIKIVIVLLIKSMIMFLILVAVVFFVLMSTSLFVKDASLTESRSPLRRRTDSHSPRSVPFSIASMSCPAWLMTDGSSNTFKGSLSASVDFGALRVCKRATGHAFD